jgi:hypothetical protein
MATIRDGLLLSRGAWKIFFLENTKQAERLRYVGVRRYGTIQTWYG